MIFAGLSSTIKYAISFLFSYYLTLALSSPPCPLLDLSFYHKLCCRSGRNCFLSPVLSGYNGSMDTRFSRGTTRLMSWPDGEHYLRLVQSLVVSLLLCLVSTLVFSRTGGALFHQNSLTHRSSRFPMRNLCSSSCSLILSLVDAAKHTAFFHVFISLGLAENPSCCACGHSSRGTSHLILHCSATESLRRLLFGDSLFLYDLLSRFWRIALLQGLHGFRHAPILRKGSGKNNNKGVNSRTFFEWIGKDWRGKKFYTASHFC